jgi:hypothetical protein
MKYKLTVYDNDGSITYESNNADEIIKQIESVRVDEIEYYEADMVQEVEVERNYIRPYERCRNAVYATGNRWAIENFNATH